MAWALLAPALDAAVPVALAAAYAGAVARRWSTGRAWPMRRVLAFGAGVVVVAIAVALPDEERFSLHVLSHLLLRMAAPPLLVLGDPVTLALQALPGRRRRRLAAALRSPVARLGTHPAVAFAAAVVFPWVLWLSPLFRLSQDHAVVHAVVHLHFLAAGTAFAVVVLGADVAGRRASPAVGLGLVALALPTHALLGLVVLSLRRPVLVPGLPAAAALADQRLGGAVLWLAGDAIATAMLAGGVTRWITHERRRAAHEDGVAVAPRSLTGGPPTRAPGRLRAPGGVPAATATAPPAPPRG